MISVRILSVRLYSLLPPSPLWLFCTFSSTFQIHPKDWSRWVQKVGIREHFVFYRYTRGGADHGYCTYCEKDVPIKHKPHHNAIGRCPCCRRQIRYKSIGKAGTVDTKQVHMFLLQKCEDGFVIREFSATSRYSPGDYQIALTSCTEMRRVICTAAGQPLRAYYWSHYKNQELRWILGNVCSTSWWDTGKGAVYGKTLPSLQRSGLQRTGLVEYIRNMHQVDPELYLAVYRKFPRLEQLAKAGLWRMAQDCISSPFWFSEHIASQPTSLSEALGLNKQQFKRLRQNNGGKLFLHWLNYEKAAQVQLRDSTISWLCQHQLEAESLNFILKQKLMSIEQIRNYITRQMSESGMSCREVITTWYDYLLMARSLRMDVTDAIVYRVRKLRQRHDELVARCHDRPFAMRAGEVIEKFPDVDAICASLKRYEYADKHYAVLAPEGVEAIMLEGDSLHHCASTVSKYWERIHQKESYILFLRKAAALDKPYYTLEVEPDGTIRQKRTMYDRQNEDIKDATRFLLKWQKVVAKRLTEEDRRLAVRSHVLRIEELTHLRENKVTIHTGDLRGQLLADVLQADLLENTEVKEIAA